ncbi:MAG: hypothetical protein JWR27_1544 [Aeromicrobium sp.]|jgi:nucleotide-binding universal stress UspA family protein|nr:hypothetical protein [Aeromicrobium sp.]
MNRPVVVGVDGRHQAPLRFAIDEARRRGAPLRVLHCAAMPFEQMEIYVSDLGYREMLAAGQRVLDETSELLQQEAPEIPTEYDLSTRTPVDLLLEEGASAQLLVIGIEDIPWYDRVLGGAVAGHLARVAPCPMVAVPEVDDILARHEGVVVALDCTRAADELLRLAFDLAQHRRCPLHALTVMAQGSAPDDIDDTRVVLGEVLAGWREAYPEVRVQQHVVVGAPDEVCRTATQGAELVLVGRSRHHGFRRPLAVSVLRHAACPVGVVPTDERRG